MMMTPGVKAIYRQLTNDIDGVPAPTFDEKVSVAIGFALDMLTMDELRTLRVAHAGLPSTGSRAMVAACDQLIDEAAALTQRALASTTSANGGGLDPFVA
jgi:hypothetical protein